jgi:hypothetical protein
MQLLYLVDGFLLRARVASLPNESSKPLRLLYLPWYSELLEPDSPIPSVAACGQVVISQLVVECSLPS